MFKRAIALALAITMIMGITTAFANEAAPVTVRFVIGSSTYSVNGETRQITNGAVPFIQADRTMLPLATVLEIFAPIADWSEEYVQDAWNPVTADGRVFVTLAYVTQELGLQIRWDGNARAVYVYNVPRPAPAFVEPEEYVEVELEEEVEAEEIEEPAEEYEAGPTPYELLKRSSEALLEIGSFLMNSNTLMTMNVLGEIMEITMDGTIAYVMRSEVDMDMRMEMTTTVLGESIEAVSYFRDGMLYMDMMGERFRMPMPLEALLQQSGLIDFPEAAIVNQHITEENDLTFVHFTLSGSYLASLVDNMLSGLGMSDLPGLDDLDLNLSDVTMVVALDEDYIMQSMNMLVILSMTVEGFTISATMNTTYEVVQLGGITVDFPDDLDEFEDLEL